MYKNKVEKFRKEKGLTMKALAEKAGISTGYVSHLEKGDRKNPSIKIMEQIATALNKTVAEVFFDDMNLD